MVEYLSSEQFKEKVFDYSANGEWHFKGDIPCLVDFYADWCGPCKMIAPVLESLGKKYDGKVKIYKINTDENPEVSSVFGIQSIPSLLFIPREGQPQMAHGALPQHALEQAFADVLKVTA